MYQLDLRTKPEGQVIFEQSLRKVVQTITQPIPYELVPYLRIRRPVAKNKELQ